MSRLKLRRLLWEEDGPTAVEYAVMLAMIISICLVGIQTLGSSTNASFNNISDSLGAAS